MDGLKFTNGWEDFAVAHNLRVGDITVFRHEGELVFHVTALGPSCCEIQYTSSHNIKDGTNNIVTGNNSREKRKGVKNNPNPVPQSLLHSSCYMGSVRGITEIDGVEVEEDRVSNNSEGTHTDPPTHATVTDNETEAVQPQKMYFPPTEYMKIIKISAKCYVTKAINNITDKLNLAELEWFYEHPQFKHFFHMKKPQHKWMGMWMLVLQAAGVEKRKELWFIVNGVPIRVGYSLRELGLISGLYCHDYPDNYERMGSTFFIQKHFESGKKITFDHIEKKLLSMEGPCSEDRLKMAVLYFLSSVIPGFVKFGKDAPSVESFFLRIVDDLDSCKKFPWRRCAFEHNLKDVTGLLEKCKRVVKITNWLLAFEAIPILKNHYCLKVDDAEAACPRMCKMKYKNVGGTKAFTLKEMSKKLDKTKDIHSILEVTPAEKSLLRRIMANYRAWKNDEDVVVDRWTEIILNGKKQICFEEMFNTDYTAGTTEIEPHAPAIDDTPVDTPAVDIPGVVDVIGLESWLRGELGDGLKEMKEFFIREMKDLKGQSLEGVKSLRISVVGQSVVEIAKAVEHQVAEDDEQSEKANDEIGGEKDIEKDDGIHLTNFVNQYKRERESEGKEGGPSKKSKVRSLIL